MQITMLFFIQLNTLYGSIVPGSNHSTILLQCDKKCFDPGCKNAQLELCIMHFYFFGVRFARCFFFKKLLCHFFYFLARERSWIFMWKCIFAYSQLFDGEKFTRENTSFIYAIYANWIHEKNAIRLKSWNKFGFISTTEETNEN